MATRTAQERVRFDIETTLGADGLEAANKGFNKLKRRVNRLNSIMKKAKGTSKQQKRFNKLQKTLKDAGVTQEEMSRITNLSRKKSSAFGNATEKMSNKLQANRKQMLRFGGALHALSGSWKGVEKNRKMAMGKTVTRRKDLKNIKQMAYGSNQYSQALWQMKDASLQNLGATEALRSKNAGFFQVMTMGLKTWKGVNDEMGGFRKAGGRVANTTRKLFHGMRGFRMELLSVMFMGMQLRKTFMGLLKPAFKTAGVMELWGTILKLLFLPAALWVSSLLVNVLDTISQMPKDVKKAASMFALMGLVIGALTMIVGQYTLGIGGMISAMANSLTVIFGMGLGLSALAKGFGIAALAAVTFIGILGLLAGDLDASAQLIRGTFGLVTSMMGITIKAVKGAITVVSSLSDSMVKTTSVSENMADITDSVNDSINTQGIKAKMAKNKLKSWRDEGVISKEKFDELNNTLSGEDGIEGSLKKITDEGILSKDQMKDLKNAMKGAKTSTENMSGVTENLSTTLSETFDEEMMSDFEQATQSLNDIADAMERLHSGAVKLWNIFTGKTVEAAVSRMAGGDVRYNEKTGEVNIYRRTVPKNKKAILDALLTGVSPIGGMLSAASGMMRGGYSDFIWRSGEGAARVSPADTIIGTEGEIGGPSENINFNPNVTINVDADSNVDIDELKSQLSREWIDELESRIRR